MSEIDDRSTEDLDDPLLRALARTPDIAPFSGTERYRVCRCLGEGGFGVVYEVEDRELGRRLALKTLKPQRCGFAAHIRRLKSEFRSVADLVHPNLVGLHELESHGERWFFTMELVRGTNFLEYVRSGVSEQRLRAALRQLVSGVAALHQAGIVHRDLKPSNVLVELNGRVVILDFGLAGGELPGEAERGLRRAGTPSYMAPEQAAGTEVTGAVDWYAVGVMLHEALTGELPRANGSPGGSGEARGAGPDDLLRLSLALLRRDPEARPDGDTILGMLGDAAPAGPETRRDALPGVFVGRARELEELRAAFAAVRRGEARLLRIQGPPGVGKSALLGRFLDELRDQGDAVALAGRCYERESVPFKAFDGIADELVRYLRELPPGQAAASMPAEIGLAAQLFPVFEEVPAIREARCRQAALADPREKRSRAFAAVAELIARIAERQTLVIAIDDLQWGDVDSTRLLAQLVNNPARPAFLLIFCYRAGEQRENPTLRETLRTLEAAGERGVDIPLQPLPPGDAERLAAGLLGGGSGATEAARTIAGHGEGHPLFIAELARELAADREAAAPPTLKDVLWQRVVRLPEDARSLLETLAVAGQPLAADLSFEAAGLRGRGTEALRALRAEQLICSDEGAVDVFHDRVRDAVLARAGAGARRMRHLALARSLERRRGGDLEALALHFEAAGEREQAARYALDAGDAAMRALAFERAAELYRMAIEGGSGAAADSATAYEKLGDALLNAGSNVAAGEAYLTAAERAEGDHATELVRRAAEQMLIVGDTEVGYRALERALEAVGETLPATNRRAKLQMAYHTVRMRLRGLRFRERTTKSVPRHSLLHLDVLTSAARGLEPNDPARSMAVRARFCRKALEVGEPHRAARGLIHAVFGVCGYKSARPAAADEILDAAEAIGERLSDPGVLGEAMLMRGMSHFAFGDVARAVDFLEKADALFSESCVGMANERRAARLTAANCHFRMGALQAARELGDSLLLDAVERSDPVAEKNVCGGVLAPVSLAADRPERARQLASTMRMEDRCASVIFRSITNTSIALYLGRPRDGVEAWRATWRRIEEMGVLAVAGFRVLVVHSLGSALLAGAESRREVREAARLARSIRGFEFPYAAAVYANLRASLAMRRGRSERAAALFDEAAARYREASMPLDAAACRYRGAELLGGEEGSARAATAEEELRAGGIARPERWAATLSPPAPAPR